MKRKAQPLLSENGQQALDQYRQVLQQLEDLSLVTTRNYLSDLRQFIAWFEDYWREDQEKHSFENARKCARFRSTRMHDPS